MMAPSDRSQAGTRQTPMEQRGAIARIAARDPDWRASYTMSELDALLAAVEAEAERKAFLRGRKDGLSVAELETKYGSFQGHIQRVFAAARKVLAQYQPHEIVDGEAELRDALAAYDNRGDTDG